MEGLYYKNPGCNINKKMNTVNLVSDKKGENIAGFENGSH